MRRIVFLALASSALAAPTLAAQTPAERAKQIEFFETRIRPVLADKCFSCHGPAKQKGGVRLDRREFVFKKSDEPLIVPGAPAQSLLMKAIRHEGEIKMPPPPKTKLPANVIEDFAAWIKLGAAWPEDKNSAKSADSRQHWAFRPVRMPALPSVKQKDWPANAIDAFILAKLESKGLTPNPPADPRTLIRRVYFDLIGLPPSYREVEEFVAEWGAASAKPQAAWEKLVDRLLADPRYGERWGRHWLDIARYADTKGYVFQEERRYPYAYTYRDWVIKAFNDDLPYDQFVMQQIAADRLVATGQAPASSQAAMGYLTLGRRFLNNVHDITDDRIDVVSRGMLGLTVACARCHDHKYDPISTKDYYGLYGIFVSSTEPKNLPLLGEPEQTKEYVAFKTKLSELEKSVADYQAKYKKELSEKNRKHRDALRALQKKVDAFKASSPAAPPRGMVLVDGPNPHDARVLLRGNPNSPGPITPRQFLTVLSAKPQPFKEGSGRLQLAHAIASKDNPLTARVLVNRLWLHHFGAGLVTSPSNFGLRADAPSHPELLDFLAAYFMHPSPSGRGAGGEGAWSIKKMHKLILLSNTYRQSSADNVKARAIDTENRLLTRANRQRLEFEPLRDALLAVAGNLDPKMFGKAVDITKAPYSHRRTIYGFIDRQNLPGVFRTFDLASPDTSTPQRYQTTVPQQALYLMNHPFVQEQTRVLLNRSEIAAAKDDANKIRQLYRVVYARNADDGEVRLGREFLKSAGGAAAWERYTQALLLANEFAFVD